MNRFYIRMMLRNNIIYAWVHMMRIKTVIYAWHRLRISFTHENKLYALKQSFTHDTYDLPRIYACMNCIYAKYALLHHLRVQLGLRTVRLIRIKYHLRMIRTIYSGFTQKAIYLRMNRFYIRMILRNNWIYASYADMRSCTHDTHIWELGPLR